MLKKEDWFYVCRYEILLEISRFTAFGDTRYKWLGHVWNIERNIFTSMEILPSINPIHCGVAQWSILTSSLINLYVNDVVNIDANVKFVNYAGDTTILISAQESNVLVIVNTANQTLSRLEMWIQATPYNLL